MLLTSSSCSPEQAVTWEKLLPAQKQEITGHWYLNLFQVINPVPAGTKQGQAFSEIAQVPAVRAK